MNEVNEVRYYLEAMNGILNSEVPKPYEGCAHLEALKPQYLVTAVKLPTGAIELAINDKNIPEKIAYILEAYDENMRLKTNPAIEVVQLMVV